MFNLFKKVIKPNIKYKCIKPDSYYDSFFESYHEYDNTYVNEIRTILDIFYENFENLEFDTHNLWISDKKEACKIWISNRWYGQKVSVNSTTYKFDKTQLARLIDLVELLEARKIKQVLGAAEERTLFIKGIEIPEQKVYEAVQKHCPQYII